MNLFELFVKIGVDDQASDKVGAVGDKIKSGLGKAAKVAGAAVTAASTAAGALVKQSTEAYANYEQLVGGVDTLFKKSSSKVQAYAANAYKTAGLSANQYMETVTSFSASLLQSVGGDTDKAAEKANMAITDMSDNANKMGSNMVDVENAYKGFAKQNYTMLDNLKLGYGGTKEEMARLLQDAEKISGVKYDLSSYSDVVDAIHVIQTEMDITGTTQREAATTIEGSVNSAKAAWQNLLTGMADDNQDFQGLVNQFVDSVATAANNILPRVQQALEGVSSLIEKLAPVISEKLPELITAVLPSLGEAALGIIQSLVDGINQSLPALLPAVVSVVTTLATGLIEMLPTILEMGLNIITQMALGIAQALPELVPTIVNVVLQIVTTLTDPETLNNLLNAAVTLITSLATGLINALPVLLQQAPVIIGNLITAINAMLPKILQMGITIIISVVQGLVGALPKIVKAAPQIITSVVRGFSGSISSLLQIGKDIISEVGDGFSAAVDGAREWGRDMIDNFISGIQEMWNNLVSTVSNTAQKVRDILGFSEPKKGPLSNFHTYAPDMMKLFAKGVKENEWLVLSQIKKSFDFGEQTISAGYNLKGSGIGSVGGYGNVNVTLGIDPNASLNALARALLPVLKVVAKEVG
nr:MAG TPA: tail tape measure protein [Caudoviricetes sp.]